MKAILNLGCGDKYLHGATNVDLYSPNVDVRHDLNSFPYPFDDSTFDEVKCQNVIEHLNDVIRVMEELHRIAKPHGSISVRVPHFRSACLYEDLTHRHGFAWRSFDMFVDGTEFYGEYSKAKFTYIRRAYTPYLFPVIYRLLSQFPTLTENLLSKFVPMASIQIELRVHKE